MNIKIPSLPQPYVFEEELLKDLKIKTLLRNLHKQSLADKAQRLNKVLTIKHSVEPDYEIWIPIELIHSNKIKKETDLTNLYFYNSDILISSSGKILMKGSKEPVSGTKLSSGYHRAFINDTSFSVHRAVACLYVPIPEHLQHLKYHELEVNHKDLDKSNNDYRNLEWCTASENIKHAIESGVFQIPIRSAGLENETTSFKVATVKIPGPYYDKQYLLLGNNDINSKGFISTTVHGICSGTVKSNFHKGCEFKTISKEEVSNYVSEMPDDLIEMIRNHDTVKERSKIIIATNITSGDEIELKGKKEIIEHGFHHARVYKCVKGIGKLHKNHTFKYK